MELQRQQFVAGVYGLLYSIAQIVNMHVDKCISLFWLRVKPNISAIRPT